MSISHADFLEKYPIEPRVRDEFGSLEVAVVSPMGNPDVYAKAWNMHPDDVRRQLLSPFSPAEIGSHLQYADLLRTNGVRLVYPHHPNINLRAGMDDTNFYQWFGKDIYCRDFLGVIDDHAILSRVSSYRNDLRMYYQRIFDRLPADKKHVTDERFTWGDALLHGNNVFVGVQHNDFYVDLSRTMSDRFQEELRKGEERFAGTRAIESILAQIGSQRRLLRIPMHSNVDLDLCMAPLPRRYAGDKRRAIVRKVAIHASASLEDHFDEIIPYQDRYEDMGTNILWINPETPVVSATAVNTIRLLKDLGYDVQALNLNAQERQELDGAIGEPGGWRCLTGVLRRANDYNFD